MIALGKKFATETKFIQEVGLSNMAQFDQAGNKEAAMVFPYSLTFKPTSQVHNLFPKTMHNNDPMAYVGQLESVAANARLYDVYAMDKPKEMGGKETMIGTLQLDGGLTKSKWGDEQLFFRHQLEDDDLKIKPEWDKYTAKCPFFG